MENTQKLDSTLETAAWGSLLIWWGITELVTVLPHGIGAIGVGLILLGVNLARTLNGIPTRGLTTVLGILALVWGGVDLLSSIVRPPLEVSTFAILLIALGIIWIARALLRDTNE